MIHLVAPVLFSSINAISNSNSAIRNWWRTRLRRSGFQIGRFRRPAFNYFEWIRVQDHGCFFKDQYRMSIRNFLRFVEFLTPNLNGNFDHELAICVWLDWVTSGDPVRRQESRFHLSIGTIQHYRDIICDSVIRSLQERYLGKHQDPEWCRTQSEYWKQREPAFGNGCIGAADGTHVQVVCRESMKSRMRCRKGCTCTNVLAACDGQKKFFYVLAGWEGSASDARIFNNSQLKKQMKPGNWLLLDGGYGFLSEYHLREWAATPSGRPQDAEELFNFRY